MAIFLRNDDCLFDRVHYKYFNYFFPDFISAKDLSALEKK
jgi:hypothetical protein